MSYAPNLLDCLLLSSWLKLQFVNGQQRRYGCTGSHPTCTCLDACTNTSVCIHMHLIQMQQKTNTSIQKVKISKINSNTTTK